MTSESSTRSTRIGTKIRPDEDRDEDRDEDKLDEDKLDRYIGIIHRRSPFSFRSAVEERKCDLLAC
jgi:hypothetical protein